jgi:hypothetical protein
MYFVNWCCAGWFYTPITLLLLHKRVAHIKITATSLAIISAPRCHSFVAGRQSRLLHGLYVYVLLQAGDFVSWVENRCTSCYRELSNITRYTLNGIREQIHYHRKRNIALQMDRVLFQEK